MELSLRNNACPSVKLEISKACIGGLKERVCFLLVNLDDIAIIPSRHLPFLSCMKTSLLLLRRCLSSSSSSLTTFQSWLDTTWINRHVVVVVVAVVVVLRRQRRWWWWSIYLSCSLCFDCKSRGGGASTKQHPYPRSRRMMYCQSMTSCLFSLAVLFVVCW